MYNNFKGMKGLGHLLKRLLPLWLFKRLLFCFHQWRAIVAVPKSWCAMRRVDKSIATLRQGCRPIRFGFYVVLESMFQMRHVFELMLNDSRFDPFIVVTPRLGWQRGDMEETIEKTYGSLVADYGSKRVFRGFHDGVFENYMNECDACAMMNLYSGLAEYHFETEHFARCGIPIFGSCYFYDQGTVHSPEYYGMSSLKYVRRFFCVNDAEKEKFIRYQHVKSDTDRLVVVGCAKSDAIRFNESFNLGPRKTILIAPHHSIIPSVDSGICIGNFFKYKDFLLSLPAKYPQINWIFRPHPHLKLRLTKDVGWNMEQWEEYVREFESHPNAVYEAGGSYYNSFERSDAIIQDCGSFLPEYFYTGKPQCYMLESEKAKREQFDEWGLELLSHTYQAFSESDIKRFIDDVVIDGKDGMKEARHKFAKERVMVNYPHASAAIVESIAEMFGRGKGRD